MYELEFALRLSQLRNIKGVSARDMSLSLGQNPGYINNIESGKALPSMTNFFYICEYLEINPSDFLNFGMNNPKQHRELEAKLSHLTTHQILIVDALIDELLK